MAKIQLVVPCRKMAGYVECYQISVVNTIRRLEMDWKGQLDYAVGAHGGFLTTQIVSSVVGKGAVIACSLRKLSHQ